MMQPDTARLYKFFVHRRRTIMLKHDPDLYGAGVAKSDGQVHVCKLAAVTLLVEGNVLKHVKQSNVQHTYPVFESGIKNLRDVGE
jgi:hypothetical protein